MNWHELQNHWQQRRDDDDGGEFSMGPPSPTAKLWGQVKRRDLLESALAVLMLPFFATAAVVFANKTLWISAGFLALVTLGVAIIPWQLWRTRRLLPKRDAADTVLDHLRCELSALNAQQAQARWAFAWYFLPLGVGVVGFYVSVSGFGRDSLVYAVLVMTMGLGIDWLNRVWAARKFEESAMTIRAQIADLEAGL